MKFLDTETTGLSLDSKIVEIASLKQDLIPLKNFHKLINLIETFQKKH